jgi:tyrosyl-tRNA synthetase
MPLPVTQALRSSIRPDLYICARCAFRASKASQKLTRRWVETKSRKAEKAEVAERAWKATADEVKQGKRKSMLSILEERGLVHDFTGSVFRI